MGINFLGLGIGKIQNNIKINSYSKNVNFKGGLDNDEIQLSEKAQVQKRIAQLEKEIAQLSNEINALKKLWHFDREGLHKEYTQKRKKCAELKKEHDFLIRTLKFLNSGLEQTRPNSAFLYDPRLSDKQKYEILSKHPEIKSLKQISEDSHHSKYCVP